jgi:NADH-quinone oxidoreductase subunit M
MVKRTIFGPVANEGVAALYDVNFRETLVLAAIAVFVLGLGLWPAPLIDLMSPTVDNLVAHITQSKL